MPVSRFCSPTLYRQQLCYQVAFSEKLKYLHFVWYSGQSCYYLSKLVNSVLILFKYLVYTAVFTSQFTITVTYYN